jgi:hypothetical protein
VGRNTPYAGELEPVVEIALEWVSRFMFRPRKIYNLRRERREFHLTDPSARSAAIKVFKDLKHHGVPFSPHLVERWARAHGWDESDALLLRDYAAGVAAGATYHADPDPFGRAYDYWVQEAKQRSQRGK